MYKSQRCGELRAEHAGQQVTLAGWVHRRRVMGGVNFIDLRDRWGLVQVVSDVEGFSEAHNALSDVRNEWVIQVVGTVRLRPVEARNANLETGDVEVVAEKVTVLNEAKNPPFDINQETAVSEALRLKYRYLDLRRERMQRNLVLRSKVTTFIRHYLSEQGFIEVETPILFKTTPEGARDYLVPSRVHPGEFYALPQSPQQLKQLLMVAGVEKYFQIARCFRDEDQRGDRQPEFTQLDMEMSFVQREDVLELVEGLMTEMVKTVVTPMTGRGLLNDPFPRLTYAEAMDKYGNDKPDIRFGLHLKDVTAVTRETGFKVFDEALLVKGLNAPGCGSYSRKQIDALTEIAKGEKAKGLAWAAIGEDGEVRSSFGKFISADLMAELVAALDGKPGDLLLFVADTFEITNEALATLRLHFGEALGLRDPNVLSFCWVVDFPLVFWNPEEERWDPSHHLFTSPLLEDIPLMDSNPGKARGSQYDLVCNGYEVAGGSIRIHQRWLQEKMFTLIGLPEDVAQERFGHMLAAFEFGTPPHGGIAPGIDRLVMLFAGEANIREVMAFPKNQQAMDLMAGAPSVVEPKQLKELHIAAAGEGAEKY